MTRNYSSPLGMLFLKASQGLLTHCSWWPLPTGDDAPTTVDSKILEETARQLDEYFDGCRTVFDIPLAPALSDFSQSVRMAMLAVPYGGTMSYGEIARRLGKPGGARGVAQACAHNPFAVIVPCHRVTASDGRLGGYTAPDGVAAKIALLDLERRFSDVGDRDGCCSLWQGL